MEKKPDWATDYQEMPFTTDQFPPQAKDQRERSTKKSSWVDHYEWNPLPNEPGIGDFIMEVQTGGRYSWDRIAKADAMKAIGGYAACYTDDKTGQMRWWPGKFPSLGAAYWQICRPFKSVPKNQFPPTQTGPAFPTTTKPVKKGTYQVKGVNRPITAIKQAPGRPTKEAVKIRQKQTFAWAKKRIIA